MDQFQSYFYEIYQTGNLTQAAKNLYLSQPALSISLAKLERQLGVTLFDRSQKPLALTAEGHLYLQAVLKVRNAEADFQHELADLQGQATGTIRIGSSQYFNSYYLPTTLLAYEHRYPQVQVHILERNSELLNQELYAGNVDLIIHCGHIDTRKVVVQPVLTDQVVLAIPKSLITVAQANQLTHFLQGEPQPAVITWLERLPFISVSATNNFRERMDLICAALSFHPQIKYEMYQLETAFHLAAHGLGATFVTDEIRQSIANHNLYYFDLDLPLAQRTFFALTRKRGYLDQPLQNFLTTLMDPPAPTL
ncbi:LysR family transcriptional regulator [Levilactobacillus acidifarinae]|uniref:HTH lysR-type domain-containing protein n=1 Tax=Levilactobacillus acidifarinae DSM 19394 = JCM 15949 TaxID=1423715 RepID=A0A0R1LRW8_9LACO|nr:LysR family transcriptional regulator [Levilactobacillus acidifarinae]KRK96339.1 hypothetical protein FD25_GL001828 [Levilactobacillus acidifarinae DSM 19394]GEO69077.1 LysR family transcriptional regulator [Levilactobacillus acidifarinae]